MRKRVDTMDEAEILEKKIREITMSEEEFQNNIGKQKQDIELHFFDREFRGLEEGEIDWSRYEQRFRPIYSKFQWFYRNPAHWADEKGDFGVVVPIEDILVDLPDIYRGIVMGTYEYIQSNKERRCEMWLTRESDPIHWYLNPSVHEELPRDLAICFFPYKDVKSAGSIFMTHERIVNDIELMKEKKENKKVYAVSATSVESCSSSDFS